MFYMTIVAYRTDEYTSNYVHCTWRLFLLTVIGTTNSYNILKEMIKAWYTYFILIFDTCTLCRIYDTVSCRFCDIVIYILYLFELFSSNKMGEKKR